MPLPGPLEPGAQLFLDLKKRYKMFSGGEIDKLGRQVSSTPFLVEGLLPPLSVGIMVGDSGVGKSPLAFQLAMAVATGTPFLGMPARRSKVLLLDLESTPHAGCPMIAQLQRHLQIEKLPPNFLYWPLPYTERVPIESLIGQLQPDLVIIDTLRSYRPAMECTNRSAATHLQRLRKIAGQRGTAFLLVHHVRKGASFDLLEKGGALGWLSAAAGARALINQSDLRLAVTAAPKGFENRADLVVGGHLRVRGDIGPFYLRRVRDANGEPLGFERVAPPSCFLGNPGDDAVFHRLPQSFRFREVRLLLGKASESTNTLLRKLMRLGVIQKDARGRYSKSLLRENPDYRPIPSSDNGLLVQ